MLWIDLKWLMVLFVWVMLTLGIIQEYRHLRQDAAYLLSPRNLPEFLRMLHLRNIQVWVLLTLLFIITAVGDLRHGYSIATPPASENIDDSEPAPVAAAATPAPHPIYDEAFAKATGSSLPFSDITEFNEKDSKQQAYLDWLKQHYEAWFVTYYYLHKCGKAGDSDIGVIDSALQQELQSAQADSTVRNNILLAATGSYNELYRDIPCDEKHLSATKASYDANMQHIKTLPDSGVKPNAH